MFFFLKTQTPKPMQEIVERALGHLCYLLSGEIGHFDFETEHAVITKHLQLGHTKTYTEAVHRALRTRPSFLVQALDALAPVLDRLGSCNWYENHDNTLEKYCHLLCCVLNICPPDDDFHDVPEERLLTWRMIQVEIESVRRGQAWHQYNSAAPEHFPGLFKTSN